VDSIRPLVSTKVHYLAPDDRLVRIAEVIARSRANAAIVATNGQLIGCVMRKLLLRPWLSPETKAERLTSHVPSADPQTTVKDAVARMLQSGCDILPAVQGGVIIGALFARDLAAQDPSFRDLSVNDASNHLAPPLADSSSISEAATCLRRMDMGSLPLVDEKGNLSGWISFSDVYRYLVAPSRGLRRTGELVGEKDRPLRNPVALLANSSGLTVSPDTSMHDAIALLCERQLNEITVVDKDAVVGHLNIMRILRLISMPPDIAVQTTGLEGEDPLAVSRILANLRSIALKIGKASRNMRAPEMRVKSYEHEGSGRKRYEVRVTFSLPEQYVAEAAGWDLVSVSTEAIRKVEKSILRRRSKAIDSHRRPRKRSRGRVGEP